MRSFVVRFCEKLTGSLPEVQNLGLQRYNMLLVLYLVKVDRILVCDMHEAVQVLSCLLSSLLAPKN